METILIVCFTAYGYPHEREFDENIRYKKVHEVLSEVCATYVITGSYIITRPIK